MEHIGRIRDVAFSEHIREPDWSWGEDLEPLGDQLLVLDQPTITPTARAQGFAALINGMAIAQLRHCTVAALYSANARGAGREPIRVDLMSAHFGLTILVCRR